MPKRGNKGATLTISPTPFKSSFLAIPPSPFSPRTPLTPLRPVAPQSQYRPLISSKEFDANVPLSPISWLWTCHECNRSYCLGVTRRCLDDGHLFCSGVTSIKNWREPSGKRKVKRHRPCASEFDYAGWKTWGRWRRTEMRVAARLGSCISNQDEMTVGTGASKRKDCWNMCDYPSECRWGRRFGVHTPIEESALVIEQTVKVSNGLLTETVGILESKPTIEDSEPLDAETCGKHSVWTVLAESAKRRRAGIGSSPLVPLIEHSETVFAERDIDGDATMDIIDPSLLDGPTTPHPSKGLDFDVSLSSAKPVEVFKHLFRRRSIRYDKQPNSCGSRSTMENFAPLTRVAGRHSGQQSSVTDY